MMQDNKDIVDELKKMNGFLSYICVVVLLQLIILISRWW